MAGPTVTLPTGGAYGYTSSNDIQLDPATHAQLGAQALALMPGGTFALVNGNPTVFFGDSNTIRNSTANGDLRDPECWVTWATLLSNSQITFLRNAGLGGDTSATGLARIQTDVIAYAPRYCIINFGTNDATAGVTLAAYSANIRAIVAALLSAKIIPILTTVIQRSDLSGQPALIEQYNAWLIAYAKASAITLIDFHGAIIDPTTGVSAVANLAGDNAHTSATGARLIGQACADTLSNVMPPWVPPLTKHAASHKISLLPNGLFQASSGGLGTGYNLSGTGATSIVAGSSPVLGNWQRLTINPNNADALIYSGNVLGGPTTYALGDRMAVCGWFQSSVNGAAGAAFHMGFFGSAHAVWPIYNVPGNVGPNIFYSEFIIGSADTTAANSFMHIPTGAGGNDWVQTAQLTLINYTKLGF